MPNRELSNQLGTLHWLLQTCYGPSNTWDHQDFTAKLKVGVEKPEMLLDLQLAKISAHIPVRIFDSVAVTTLQLLQRSMRIAMSSKTLLSLELLFVALLASQKLALPHASRKKEHYRYGTEINSLYQQGDSWFCLENQHHVCSSFPGLYNWNNVPLSTLWGLTEVITGLGRGCVFKTKNLLFAVQMWSMLMLQVAKKISSDHSK